jgi:hypothetical protein
MKQQKLSHRLFAPALALPDILLGLPFATSMAISSARKSSRQSGIYTDMPSNANALLAVKAKYICPGVLGGALCNGPAYGPNTKHAQHPRRRPAQQARKGE